MILWRWHLLTNLGRILLYHRFKAQLYYNLRLSPVRHRRTISFHQSMMLSIVILQVNLWMQTYFSLPQLWTFILQPLRIDCKSGCKLAKTRGDLIQQHWQLPISVSHLTDNKNSHLPFLSNFPKAHLSYNSININVIYSNLVKTAFKQLLLRFLLTKWPWIFRVNLMLTNY